MNRLLNKQTKSLILAIFLVTGAIFYPAQNYLLAQTNIDIMDIKLENVNGKTVKIKWVTNTGTSGKVLFGPASQNLPYFIIDSQAPTTLHEVVLGNLQPETTYYYQVVAFDNYSQSTSFVDSFKTTEYHDELSPIISNLKIPYVSGTAVFISWETDKPAYSTVEYGRNETYTQRVGINSLVTKHVYIIGNLLPGTKYYVRLYAVDKSNNKSGVFQKEFETLSSDAIDKEDLKISYLRPSGPDDSYISQNDVRVSFKTNHFAKGNITISGYGFKTQTQELDYGTSQEAFFYALASASNYTIDISLVDIFNKWINKRINVTTDSNITSGTTVISGTAGANSCSVNTTYGIATGQLASTQSVQNICAGINYNADASGYYGQYYNLTDQTDKINTNGTNYSPAETTWFSSQYFSFARVDQNLNFGWNFYPVNNSLSGDPFYFSAYWQAILAVPEEQNFNYSISADNSGWVYIDNQPITSMGDRLPLQQDNKSIKLSKGYHLLEIYFTERGPGLSNFSFVPQASNIKIHPWPKECFNYRQGMSSAKTGNATANANSNVVVAGVEMSYYTPASALYKTKDSPDVYSIVNGQHHFISSPTSFLEYGYNWQDIKTVGWKEILKYPRARLIKSPEKDTIYYLYQRPEDKWLKIVLTSPSVFISYPGNYWGNIITVTQLDIDSYPDVKLIKTKDNSDIYYLENNIRRYVSPEVLKNKGFNIMEVVEVNKVHMESYKIGPQLE